MPAPGGYLHYLRFKLGIDPGYSPQIYVLR